MKLLDRQIVISTPPFDLERMHLEVKGQHSVHPWYRLLAPDWVNVLPVTADGKAILVRQPRAGVLKTTLECPGGTVDADEKDPTVTAARELEEETGYHSQRFLALGSAHSNPAICTNRIHFFLALGCQPNRNRQHFPDENEAIELVPTPIANLEDLVRTSQIDHALSALCIMLAQKYLFPSRVER